MKSLQCNASKPAYRQGPSYVTCTWVPNTVCCSTQYLSYIFVTSDKKKPNLRQMPQIILRRFLIKRINLLFRADHLYQAATSLMKNPLANSHHVPCYNPTRSIQFIKSKSGINQLVRPEKDKRLNVKTRCSESYRDRGKCLSRGWVLNETK